MIIRIQNYFHNFQLASLINQASTEKKKKKLFGMMGKENTKEIALPQVPKK